MESVAARICREAGGRVTTNVMVRDMDLVRPDVHDTRRLEVVVDGLSSLCVAVSSWLWTPHWSVPFMQMGKHGAMLHAKTVALEAARRRKERTYPELTARGGRARLVVFGVEVGEVSDEETRGTSMAPSLGLPPVLRCRTCSRHVFAGPSRFQRV